MARTKSDLLRGINKPVASSKFIGNNTLKVCYEDGTVAIRLHDTDVATFRDGQTILSSGGWRTNTTRDRIRQYANVNIRQYNGTWLMPDGSAFYDGIVVNAAGDIVSEIKMPPHLANEKMRRQISKYVALVTKENLPVPNNGDCWDCLLRTEEGKTMGDAFGHTDHLINHMEEGYLHGSILVNAMREAGYTDNQIGVHYAIKVADTFKRALRRYLNKRLIK